MSINGKQPMRSMSFFQQREFKRVIRTYNAKALWKTILPHKKCLFVRKMKWKLN